MIKREYILNSGRDPPEKFRATSYSVTLDQESGSMSSKKSGVKSMETNNSTLNGAVSNDNQDDTNRRVSSTKVARLKQVMNGAEKRMIRLTSELLEYRAIIRRKYTDVFNAQGEVVGRNLLHPEQVLGYKLQRTQIETDLAVSKGDFLKARREYRKALTNNIQIERKSGKLIREENRIRRESSKSLRLVKETLKQHGQNGGAKDLALLTSLAIADDVKGFRVAFDESVGRFEPALYTVISGVSQVKTEIIHSVMEELADENRKDQPITSLTSAVEPSNQ
jgi:hypothetical protein